MDRKKEILKKCNKAIVIAYGIIIVLFVGLLAYMGLHDRAEIYNARSIDEYYEIVNVQKAVLHDEAFPLQKADQYTLQLGTIDNDRNCLAFYLVHQTAAVYLDEELIYQITTSSANTFGENISSNWVKIPIYREDSNRTLKIVVTPWMESVEDRDVEFLYGTPLSIYKHQMKSDIIEIVLAGICIGVGFMILFVQHLFRNRKNWMAQISLLGVFAILIGFWRLTDTEFSAILFSNNPMVLGYITVAALFLCTVPILLFIRNRYRGERTVALTAVVCVSIALSYVAWILQVTGIADLRKLLNFSHAMILIAVIVALYTVFFRNKKAKVLATKFSKVMIFLLAAGTVLDVTNYYLSDGKNGLICLLTVFLIYVLALFFQNSFEVSQRMYTDTDTGFFNRKRWDVLLERMEGYTKPMGIIIFDLNSLKQINDTFGHDAGDKAILNFANVLRNSLDVSNTICRWGGDEFSVLVLNATKAEMEELMDRVKAGVDDYNRIGTPCISYAGGYALSTDYADLNLKELFEKADENMYANKKKWHAEHADL